MFIEIVLRIALSYNDVIIIPFDNEQSIIPHNYIHLRIISTQVSTILLTKREPTLRQ